MGTSFKPIGSGMSIPPEVSTILCSPNFVSSDICSRNLSMLTVKDEVKPWNAPSEDTDPFNWGKEIEEKVCLWENVLIATLVYSAYLFKEENIKKWDVTEGECLIAVNYWNAASEDIGPSTLVRKFRKWFVLEGSFNCYTTGWCRHV